MRVKNSRVAIPPDPPAIWEGTRLYRAAGETRKPASKLAMVAISRSVRDKKGANSPTSADAIRVPMRAQTPRESLNLASFETCFVVSRTWNRGKAHSVLHNNVESLAAINRNLLRGMTLRGFHQIGELSPEW
jgi:hypothetical protein